MFYLSELKRYDKWFRSKVANSIDYEYKSFCLKNNIDKEVNKISWNLYCNDFCFIYLSVFLQL